MKKEDFKKLHQSRPKVKSTKKTVLGIADEDSKSEKEKKKGKK